MSIILITGANKGLGYEAARQLTARDHTVYVGARDVERGEAAAKSLGAESVQLDVTDDASVQSARDAIEKAEGHLDVVVNNAGIELRQPDGGFIPAAEMDADAVRRVFDTNLFGHIRMLQAFLPLLRRSANPVIVNVSSGLAVTAALADSTKPEHFYPDVAYPASKAAVNMLTVQYAKAFGDIRINAVDPGFTSTDLNHHQGTQTVEEGAAVIVRMATIDKDGPTGTFQSAEKQLSW
jgi:NAD(P)-dependent dehydrogenase (short-subunit alcohol dehydrogenase family)